MIEALAHRIESAFPTPTRASNNGKHNESTRIFERLSTPRRPKDTSIKPSQQKTFKHYTPHPDHLRQHISSKHFLSPLTSLALHDLPRSESSNRIANEPFTLLLHRKLRILIIGSPRRNACIRCQARELAFFCANIFRRNNAARNNLTLNVDLNLKVVYIFHVTSTCILTTFLKFQV
jgi:hypothetical protein